jgi:uncharacterized iron-regulated membrane protein
MKSGRNQASNPKTGLQERMMAGNNNSMKVWCWVHKWTSLVCTLFLLMLCLTGLPLVFHDEIEAMGADGDARVAATAADKLITLDQVIVRALQEKPGDVPLYMSFDEDQPVVNITTGPTADAAENQMSFFPVDRRIGELVEGEEEGGVMDFILQLHTDMLLGLPGMLLLGFMGFLFFLSVLSGIIIYRPFMRKLEFGTVRYGKATRTKWLDYHNLLGIVTLAWAIVVGLTGTINTLSEPITAIWRVDVLESMTAGETGAVAPFVPGTAGPAVDAALKAAPGMRPQFVAFPGVAFSSRDHLAVFLQGATPLNKKLLTPVLVDARDGKVDAIAPMPWYMKGLLLSQPLHFGDYGGLPMKFLWALLDIITIIILGSGVYLWLGKKITPPSSYFHPQAATA